MKNRFSFYNDYELLYYINNGSEAALEILYDKYSCLTIKVINDYFPYLDIDKRKDLHQEGLITLFDCIRTYNPDGEAMFYTYYRICLLRRCFRLIKDPYYSDIIFNEDIKELDAIPDDQTPNIKGERFFSDPLKIQIFDTIVIGNMQIMDFARQIGLSYYIVKKEYDEIIRTLKDSINNKV